MKKEFTIFTCAVLTVAMLFLSACNHSVTPGTTTSDPEEGTTTQAAPTQETSIQETTMQEDPTIDQGKPYDDASYSITISINPLVKLLMSTEDKVLEVQCLNADSETAYSKIIDDLIGKPVAQATEAIVQSAIEQGYLKEGASCTISCEDVWDASSEIVEQFIQIQQTVQTVLTNENRDDAVIVIEVAEAVDILEAAGIQVNEDFKAEFVDVSTDEQPTKSQYHDDDLWPNLLFIMKPGQKVEEVVFLNDSANRAYAGVTQDVVNMRDVDAARVYLAAAYENGYLKDQFNYDADADIPNWIHDKLIVFKNYDEAIYQGYIPIPHEFWSQCPRIAFLIDDNEKIAEVFYLNDSAVQVLSDINYIGQDPMSVSGKVVSACYRSGYIRFTNIPEEMFEHIITICNEEEAQALGLK